MDKPLEEKVIGPSSITIYAVRGRAEAQRRRGQWHLGADDRRKSAAGLPHRTLMEQKSIFSEGFERMQRFTYGEFLFFVTPADLGPGSRFCLWIIVEAGLCACPGRDRSGLWNRK
jgi:hypothetical protein